jgi:prevent-host-death family protein
MRQDESLTSSGSVDHFARMSRPSGVKRECPGSRRRIGPTGNPFALEAATIPAWGCPQARLAWCVGAVRPRTLQVMSELPIEQAQAHLGEVVEDAERAGEVVYLTRHGRRVAAIVSP